MPYASSKRNRTAPHRKNAALPNQSPYQERSPQTDNLTLTLIKQAVDVTAICSIHALRPVRGKEREGSTS